MKQEARRMLTVDLYVPELDEVFDFEIEDDAVVRETIKKMQELLEGAENIRLQKKDYGLYAVWKGRLLAGNAAFGEQEVQSGELLVWV